MLLFIFLHLNCNSFVSIQFNLFLVTTILSVQKNTVFFCALSISLVSELISTTSDTIPFEMGSESVHFISNLNEDRLLNKSSMRFGLLQKKQLVTILGAPFGTYSTQNPNFGKFIRLFFELKNHTIEYNFPDFGKFVWSMCIEIDTVYRRKIVARFFFQR